MNSRLALPPETPLSTGPFPCRPGLILGLLLAGTTGLSAADWPQWMGPSRDGVWREDGILKHFPEHGPTTRWRTPVGAGFAGPAVANGRVFLTDRVTGKPGSGENFRRGVIPGQERVHCLEERTGRILWTHAYDCPYDVSYPAGPRATPVVDQDRVYTLGTEGHLFCLNAKTGAVLWAREFKMDFAVQTPLWGFAAHPLIEGDQLICLARGPGSTVVAFDKHSGREVWRSLSAREPGYCPPVIHQVGGSRQLIIWHPESVNGLNPATGETYWSLPFKIRSGLTVAMPRLLDNQLFLTAFYDGPIMLNLDPHRPAASLAWRGQSRSERKTDGLHSLITTPFLEEGHIYGVGSYGELRCLRMSDGQRLWSTHAATTGQPDRWATAFLVKHEDRFFIFNERGELLIARLSPAGYEELGRTKILEPTGEARSNGIRAVVWSHPAYANQSLYARNDKEIVCVSLKEPDSRVPAP